jgi:glycosyltransferase involved in cell wall biosynthesis
LAGRGLEHGKTGLAEEASAASLQPRNFHLLGERSDIPAIMNAMDVFTLSSFGEGFPNAIGEAMSCGVPCVATNVGDVPRVVNGTGILVSPRDVMALASGWEKMIEMSSTDRYAMGRAARNRIVSLYSLPMIVARYETLYQELAAEHR